jgi:two-component system NtrC family sensor kinase
LTSDKSNQPEVLLRILPSQLVDRLKRAGYRLVIELYDRSGSPPDPEALKPIIEEFENVYKSELASHKLAALGSLCAGVSHEARNILTGVLGFSQVGKERVNDPKAVLDALSLIEQESVRCVELLSSYLDLARDREGTFQPVSVRDIVDQAVRLMSYEVRRRQCKLEVTIDPKVPPVRARSAEMRQVILNLLVNALQAGNEGTSVQVRAASRSRDWVEIEVIDDGPGIAKEIQHKIFEPYFSTKPRGQGTGLGLYLCRKIVDDHGGELTLRSAPGQGATFVIRLPVYRDSSEGLASPKG